MKLPPSISKVKNVAFWSGASETGVPLRVISRTLIRERPWVTNASAWVREKVGVDGVCEPCALLATFRGRLILPKTASNGVAVAIVEEAPGL